MEITLTFSRKPSSTCEKAWPISRLTPPKMRMSVIDRTAAKLTARFRQKLCQALLSANLRFRNIVMVAARTVISGNLPSVDRNDAATEEIDDLTVVRRHHTRGASRVYEKEELHELPRRGGVEVAGGFVRDDHPRRMHQRPRDGHALLLATGEVGGIRLLLPRQTNRVERLRRARLHQSVGLAENAQRERHVLVDGEVRQQLEVLEDQADLAPVVRQLAPLHAAELDAFDEDLALRGLLLPDQEADHGRFPRARRADEENEVALGNDEIDVSKRLGSGRIGLPDVLEADNRPAVEIWC